MTGKIGGYMPDRIFIDEMDCSDYTDSFRYFVVSMEREQFILYIVNEYGNFIHKWLIKHPRVFAWKIFNFLCPKQIIKDGSLYAVEFRGSVHTIQQYRSKRMLLNSLV